MEKETKFRIIELPEYQVLLTKDFGEEEETFLLVISFFLEGVKLDLKLGYKEEKSRDTAFGNITEERAQTFIDNMLKQLGQ